MVSFLHNAFRKISGDWQPKHFPTDIPSDNELFIIVENEDIEGARLRHISERFYVLTVREKSRTLLLEEPTSEFTWFEVPHNLIGARND